MKTFILLFCSFLFLTSSIQAQEVLRLSLEEVIVLAQSDAPDALLAKTKLSNDYWRNQSYLSNFKPQISLDATLPSINRLIQQIPQPDGSFQYKQRAFMTNSFGVSLEQDIVKTGGSVFATTGLERQDLFATNGVDASQSYLSTPISIGFQQPLFSFNALKWAKKIEPLRYKEATRDYAGKMEQIAFEAAQLFFNVYINQINLQAAQNEKSNADTLYNISKGRFSVGRIAETELLQIELSVMNADTRVSQAKLDLQGATENLRNYLGISKQVTFDLSPPTDIPDFEIDSKLALEQAYNNRSTTIQFERRLKEAEQEIAQAEGNTGLIMNISGSFGLSQTATTFGEAYANPIDQEQLRVGINLPIADWGKTKAQLEIAQSNFELEQMNIRQEKISFEQEILIKVQQFDLVRRQVELSNRAYEVSQKREDITRKRYFIGKIGITELNIAIQEKENARRTFMSALRNYWIAHYELRALTLYDFANGETLFKRVEGY